jgi:hypothetical protein
MEIQTGDRFIDRHFKWEVLTRPAARARIRRPELPESGREMTWHAHERVAIRRGW